MAAEDGTRYDPESYTGALEATPDERFVLLLNVLHRNPLAYDALKVLRSTGVRGANRLTLERTGADKNHAIYSRTFHPMTDHQVNAMLAADSLADLTGLSSWERNLLVGNALMHDADKYLEVQALGLRDTRGSDDDSMQNAARAYIADAMVEFNVTRDHPDAYYLLGTVVEQRDVLAFHNEFDSRVKIPLITRRSEHLGLTPEERQTVVTLNAADSVGEMPILVARTLAFLDSVPNDDVVLSVRDAGKVLRAHGDLPEVEGSNVDFMALLTLYCDGMSVWRPANKAHTVGLVEKRLRDVIARGAYAELDEGFRDRYGIGYWELALPVQQAIGRIVKQRGVELQTVDPDLPPEFVPMEVFDNLQQRVNATRDARALRVLE